MKPVQKPTISSFTIIMIFVCLVITGLSFIPLLTVKLVPSKQMSQLGVYYQMPNTSAQVIEMEVTARLESMLNRVKGIKSIESRTVKGSGTIWIEIDKNTKIDVVRFEISSLIRQIWNQLPEGVSYPQIMVSRPDDKADEAFMSFSFNSSMHPSTALAYINNYIKPELSQIEGISNIEISGATPMEWRLEYDYNQLRNYDIQVEDIKKAIRSYLDNTDLGIIPQLSEQQDTLWIRTMIKSNDTNANFSLGDVSVKKGKDRIILLKQLVKISRQEQTPDYYYRINGRNTIYLSIYADQQANQLQLSKKILEQTSRLKSRFPDGLQMNLSYDATDYISKELNKIYYRSGLTLLILMFFILLISRNWKYLILITLSIIASLSVAVIFYYLFNLEIQFYSLSGITISLGLITDNIIVMTLHILDKRNRRFFTALLASALTTISSLIIIFFLEEKIRLNLEDFAKVIIINLLVSLFVALFLLPALIDKLKITKRKGNSLKLLRGSRFRGKRSIVYFNRAYLRINGFTYRYRKILFTAVVLIFGIPVFLLPSSIEGDTSAVKFYNYVIGSVTYQEKLKPVLDEYLGGTLRLFIDKVYSGSYFTDQEETKLTITVSMQNGATIGQMDEMIGIMEKYLSQFTQIRQFQTTIMGARKANIIIYFNKEAINKGFPYHLKSQLITKALELGGASWGIFGLGDGFSNDVKENAGNNLIALYGYDYDNLLILADSLKFRLEKNKRIKDVLIRSEYSWYKDDFSEYEFSVDNELLNERQLLSTELFTSLHDLYKKDEYVTQIPFDNNLESVVISSEEATKDDIWLMTNKAIPFSGNQYPISRFVSMDKKKAAESICKVDQQYRVYAQFAYIGGEDQATRIQKREVEKFSKNIPLGYKVEAIDRNFNWGQENKSQYWFLPVIIVIIFFICSILFNSLRLPLIILSIIPIAYIGVFLTFYLFHLNFDQGGFASFILLTGITVNASIYIINDYHNILKTKRLSHSRAYMKAFNSKITAISLTIISTALGFLPFIIGNDREGFWFPLAAGTIGGLIFSLIGIILFMPIFIKSQNRTKKKYINSYE